MTQQLKRGHLTAIKASSRFLLNTIVRELQHRLPAAWMPGMLQLLLLSDTWLVYRTGGVLLGTVYFVRHPSFLHLHGGFWDGRLFDKTEIVKAIIKEEVAKHGKPILVALLSDRIGKVWEWYLKRIGFQRSREVPGFILLELKEN